MMYNEQLVKKTIKSFIIIIEICFYCNLDIINFEITYLYILYQIKKLCVIYNYII